VGVWVCGCVGVWVSGWVVASARAGKERTAHPFLAPRTGIHAPPPPPALTWVCCGGCACGQFFLPLQYMVLSGCGWNFEDNFFPTNLQSISLTRSYLSSSSVVANRSISLASNSQLRCDCPRKMMTIATQSLSLSSSIVECGCRVPSPVVPCHTVPPPPAPHPRTDMLPLCTRARAAGCG
jgi:hypothetical protein